MNGPTLVAPYCGGVQPVTIPVPARIAYKYIDPEEGPWVMLSYASLYPGGENAELAARAWVPPPVEKTDLWSAMQTFPL